MRRSLISFTMLHVSNPFGMGAGVSKILSQAEVNHPMYERGLRRLQHRIDEFNEEVAKLVQYWFLFFYYQRTHTIFGPTCLSSTLCVLPRISGSKPRVL